MPESRPPGDPSGPLPESPRAGDPPSEGAVRSSRLGRTWGLGTAAVFLFALLGVTGLVLTFAVGPDPALAALDLRDFLETSSLAAAATVHRTASHLVVVLVWLHLFRVFTRGAYRSPRRANWQVGLLLLVLTVALVATGVLVSGNPDHDGAALVLRRPEAVAPFADGAAAPEPVAPGTARAVYALHCLALPALLLGALVWHVRRARRDDATEARRTAAGEPT